MSKRAIELKKVARSRLAPFDQCLKLRLTDLAFLTRGRQTGNKQRIHLSFNDGTLALPSLKHSLRLHVTSPLDSRVNVPPMMI